MREVGFRRMPRLSACLLELSLEVEEIYLRPSKGICSANIIREILRVRELNLHYHKRVGIRRDIEDLIRFADDAAHGLRAFDFRIVRVDEFRLEQSLVSIVDAEHDLRELRALR